MYAIKVSGMTCGSCAAAIRYVLKEADPNVQVSVDLKRQIINVEGKLEEWKVRQAIEDAGFPVEEMKLGGI